MDSRKDYVKIIEATLNDCVAHYATPDARMFTVIDQDHRHFLIIEEGWVGNKHLYNPFVHIELDNETVWIQQDYTNQGIANDLVRKGIPQERIVLGYKAPAERQEAEFALA